MDVYCNTVLLQASQTSSSKPYPQRTTHHLFLYKELFGSVFLKESCRSRFMRLLFFESFIYEKKV